MNRKGAGSSVLWNDPVICSFRKCTFKATKDQLCLLHDAWLSNEEDFDPKVKNSFVELRFTSDQWCVKMADFVQYEGERSKAFSLAIKLSQAYRAGVAIFAPNAELAFLQSASPLFHCR